MNMRAIISNVGVSALFLLVLLAFLPTSVAGQPLNCVHVALGLHVSADEIRRELNRELAGQVFELAMPGRYLTIHEVSRVAPVRGTPACDFEVHMKVELRRPVLRNLHGTTIVRGKIVELRPWSSDLGELTSGRVRPCHIRMQGLIIHDMGLGGVAGDLRNALHTMYGNRILRQMENLRIC